MSDLSTRALAKLAKREVLRVDGAGRIAIKRNVHEFVVDVPAKRFARAFHEVMTEPDARFGRIDVRRAPARRGEPFAVGERFHGAFSLAASMPRLARAVQRLGLGRVAAWFEDSFCSDYSEITRLVEHGDVFAASYAYLSGSPIAGESHFEVTALGPSRCRLEAVFAYQEIGALAVLVLHLFAARLHDDVVSEQVQRAAAHAGGRLVSATTDFFGISRASGAARPDSGVSSAYVGSSGESIHPCAPFASSASPSSPRSRASPAEAEPRGTLE